MAKNRDLKVELINELAFLIGLQEKHLELNYMILIVV